MKKLFVLAAVLGSGFGLGVVFVGVPLVVRAGGEPVRETRTPGDTNCDQKLDMSDAIFTLNYLFLGTAFPPCPIADPPELVARIAELEAELAAKSSDLAESSAQVLSLQADLAEKNAKLGTSQAALASSQEKLAKCQADLAQCGAPLPDTGQSNCYDRTGGEIPCGEAACQGQDAQYATGCPSEGRFTDNGDGTVTDHCTGLMWQKDTADVNGDGQTPADGTDSLRRCDALAYCEDLSFAGHYDWRLPNVRELQSIVDYGRVGPSIDPVFGAFPNNYWSSTQYTALPDTALLFTISFKDAAFSIDGEDSSGYVRAVRNAP